MATVTGSTLVRDLTDLTSISTTGNITVGGTVDGRDVATDGSKLDGIEASATADQTAAEILTAIKTVDGSGSGLDADTLDSLQVTSLVSNNYFQDNSGGGGGNVSNSYLTSTFTTNNYVDGRFTSNNFVKGIFTSNNYIQTQLGTKLNSSSYTASDVLTKIKTVDGSGSGLDADTLDGLQVTSLTSNNYLQGLGFTTNVGDVANAYLISTFTSNNYVQTQLGTKLNSSSYTASDVLTKIKTVDGTASGLDADLLDGLQGSSYSSNNYITNHYASNNYIQTYVSAQVASVIDSAPAALDTLNELAAALGDDSNFSTTVSNQIGIRSTNTYVNSTFSSNNYLQGQLGTKLNSSSYTASDVLTKIKTVDGSGSGLDADTLDGLNSTSLSSNNYIQTQLGTKLNSSSYTASDVLTKIKTVDGSGSGLDADTLDSLQVTSLVSNNYFQDNSGGGGGGATGGGSDEIFYENDQTVTTNYTLTANKNAMSAGPITVNGGVTVTIPSGASWTVV